jgi:hypothetical protein
MRNGCRESWTEMMGNDMISRGMIEDDIERIL